MMGVEANSTTELQSSRIELQQLKVYRKRWIMLAVFAIVSACNGMQWVQYSMLSNVMTKYYGISTKWVDWTSLVYMVVYVVFIFPASYILDRWGLRVVITLGAIGNCAGAWIKVASIQPDLFWVGLIGQVIAAFAQLCVLSIPPRLAAVWFDTSQVSTACSLATLGNQVGYAVGFVLPPMMVPGGDSESTQHELFLLFVTIAGMCSVSLGLVLFLFKGAPPTPPSFSAQGQLDTQTLDFLGSVKRLMVNPSYILLFLSYGILVGVFYALSTMLNQLILLYYPDGAEEAGTIGLIIIVAGIIGSAVCGVILDRFKKYKETTLFLYGLSLVAMITFTFTLSKGIVVVYVISFSLGFFMTGLFPVGFEFAAELTYPEPEGTSSGLLNASANAFGIIFTNVYSTMFYNLTDIWANIFTCVMLFIGVILTVCIKSDLRRQEAEKQKT